MRPWWRETYLDGVLVGELAADDDGLAVLVEEVGVVGVCLSQVLEEDDEDNSC